MLVDLVKPVSYYQQGSCNLFRHIGPQRPSDGACHIDLFPSFRYNGKVTIDLSDLFRLPGRDPLLSLLQGHVKYLILVRIRKVYKIFKLRSEEHTSELQSRGHLVCRLLLEKKK